MKRIHFDVEEDGFYGAYWARKGTVNARAQIPAGLFYSWTLVRAARHARHRKPPAQRVEANFRYATKTFPLA